MLVVVLEKVARLRCPLDQLALLEFIQLVTDLSRVLRLSHQGKKYVMKNVVCHEQRDHYRNDQLKRQNTVQGCSCGDGDSHIDEESRPGSTVRYYAILCSCWGASPVAIKSRQTQIG